MLRPLAVAVMVAFGLCAGGRAATLEYLSMDDMIAKSTEIVRARVVGSSVQMRGPHGRGTIYTHYALQVSEHFKGGGGERMDVAVPGGQINGLRQTFPGAPALEEGKEYVFFLWTSRSGLTHIIGLSQGLFSVRSGSKGKAIAARAASNEPMIGPDGSLRRDEPHSIPLSDLRARIAISASRKAVR